MNMIRIKTTGRRFTITTLVAEIIHLGNMSDSNMCTILDIFVRQLSNACITSRIH